MRWRKLGLVFRPDASRWWSRSHAMIPTPVLQDAQTIRVYVTCCDSKMIGRPCYVDLDAGNPLRVVCVAQNPVMDVGIPGTFDENGVLVCSVVDVDATTRYLYYAGFELGHRIRYRLLTGLAVSRDGGESFARLQHTPILERSSSELYFRCGPFVRHEDGLFRMWYVAGSEWLDVGGKAMPVYDLRYQESSDGIRWDPEGRVCLSVENPDEHGFGRPYVVRDGSRYRLFYSIRRISIAAYRLGYAESQDGVNWERKDGSLGLDVSSEGWDSRAIMYSSVISVHGRTYLFYNGNNFGEDGFGVAVLEEA